MNRLAILAAALLAIAGSAAATGASYSASVTLPTGETHTVDAYADDTGDAGASIDGQPVGADPTDPQVPALPEPSVPTLPAVPTVPSAPELPAPAVPEVPSELPAVPTDPTQLPVPSLPNIPVVPLTPPTLPAPGPAADEIVQTVEILVKNAIAQLPL